MTPFEDTFDQSKYKSVRNDYSITECTMLTVLQHFCEKCLPASIALLGNTKLHHFPDSSLTCFFFNSFLFLFFSPNLLPLNLLLTSSISEHDERLNHLRTIVGTLQPASSNGQVRHTIFPCLFFPMIIVRRYHFFLILTITFVRTYRTVSRKP